MVVEEWRARKQEETKTEKKRFQERQAGKRKIEAERETSQNGCKNRESKTVRGREPQRGERK